MKLEPFNATFQQEDDSCYAVTLKVILDKLAVAHNKLELRGISVHKLNSICGYKKGFAVMGDSVIGLDRLYNKYLKKNGYTIKRGDNGLLDLNNLIPILNNNNFSPPIVSVGEKYYTEHNKGYHVSEVNTLEYQHQLIVNDIHKDTDEIELFDPDTPRLRQHNESINKNGLVKIPISHFIDYWDSTKRDTIWITKGKEEPTLEAGQKGLIK
ncbi:MAG: hypothetical protein ABR981_05220 [Candidatus Micrarchaeaceae archaeon]|jgi:hypothetical protein